MTSKDENTTKGQKKRKARYRQLSRLESVLKVKFRDKSVLNKALTHRSILNELNAGALDNERLEHLGDSVLGFIISEYLYKHYTKFPEGNLAKIKSVVVSDRTLSREAEALNLGEFILMGKGEENSGGRTRTSILANTLEAVIGAVYLDCGLKQCRKFILSIMKKHVENIDNMSNLIDPKTTLQEKVQKKYKESPVYEVIDEKGPAHRREFVVKLLINGKEISRGTGSSKRKAEMKAAQKAIDMVRKGEISI